MLMRFSSLLQVWPWTSLASNLSCWVAKAHPCGRCCTSFSDAVNGPKPTDPTYSGLAFVQALFWGVHASQRLCCRCLYIGSHREAARSCCNSFLEWCLNSFQLQYFLLLFAGLLRKCWNLEAGARSRASLQMTNSSLSFILRRGAGQHQICEQLFEWPTDIYTSCGFEQIGKYLSLTLRLFGRKPTTCRFRCVTTLEWCVLLWQLFYKNIALLTQLWSFFEWGSPVASPRQPRVQLGLSLCWAVL